MCTVLCFFNVFAYMGTFVLIPENNLISKNFETEETALLISLWSDPTTQSEDESGQQIRHMDQIANRMRLSGYNRSIIELDTKVKQLIWVYNIFKEDVQTGRISQPPWIHFSAMHKIMAESEKHVPDADTKSEQIDEDVDSEMSTSETDIIPVDDDNYSHDNPVENVLTIKKEPQLQTNVEFREETVTTKEEPLDFEDMEVLPDERLKLWF